MLDGCGAIGELGGARLGERTMLDALIPFARAFTASVEAQTGTREALSHALGEAKRGAENTARMMPKRGRSSYLGARAIDYPDPGAVAVTVWLEAVVAVLNG